MPIDVYPDVINGFHAVLSPEVRDRLRRDPDVTAVIPNATVVALGEQIGPPWHLDRLDQRVMPLNNKYLFETTGKGVDVYVLDGAIDLTHSEFEGRAGILGNGGTDASVWARLQATQGKACQSHGTAVAGVLAGAQSGVAKSANLISVRVLDCNGKGNLDGIANAVEQVGRAIAAAKPRRAVLNFSVGVKRVPDAEPLFRRVFQNLDDAVIVAAAGNDNEDACFTLPAGIPEILTVGATTSKDLRRFDSNFGKCVDVFAPGDLILTTFPGGPIGKVGGTSYAAPIVSGIAARLLERYPAMSARDVVATILRIAVPQKVEGGSAPAALLACTDGMDDGKPGAVDKP
ncbi:MAG: S8 family peptidase [Gemmatimonadaceae bacterium]|nr:S8 family peptidase [Gemmatimonadaceae bacterium]